VQLNPASEDNLQGVPGLGRFVHMALAINASTTFEKLLESTGRFRLVRRLGQGGSGLVYAVYDRDRGEEVALKTLSVPSAAAIYRLKREFRALADVAHPNLAVLHELFCVGNEWCFTMGLVQGEDFFSFVSQEPKREELSATGALPILDRGETPAAGLDSQVLGRGMCDLGRLRRAFEQLVLGVSALHESGHLHLDLKPANVLVRPDGSLVVLDFGLVRETGSNTSLTDPSVSGTPAYMAPEQVVSAQPGPPADWYAVGAMLYEALTGTQPYSGHAVAVLMTKVKEDPPAPDTLVPGVPREWSELCMRLLDRNPNTRCGYEEIRAWLGATPALDGQRHAAGGPQGAPFVGRADALEKLERARRTVVDGKPRALLVHGPSGIGKTALVQEFMRRLGGSPKVFLLEGRCFERESVPYKALDSLIDALSRVLRALPPEQAARYAPLHAEALVRVFPVLARVPALATRGRFATRQREEQQERDVAFQALKSLLARMGDERPVVMFIDDLQWGDRDSALLVRELLTPPDPPRLLLLGTHRSGEDSPFLSAFAGSSADTSMCTEVERIALDKLGESDAVAVVRAMLEHEGEDQKLAQLIAAESEGNPFLASELVRSARGRDGELRARATINLDQVLLERFLALPVSQQALLEIISVIGRPVDRALVLSVSGLGPQGNPSFDALRSARLIRTRGGRDAELVEHHHDRVREVVSNNVAPARRAILHALVARELEARGKGDAELLMMHHTEAGDTERAAHYAIEAARLASASFAYDHAARLLRRALEHQPVRPASELATLHAELGQALERAGRSAEAADAYLAAAEHAEPARAAELRLSTGAQLLVCGRYARGMELLRETAPEFGIKLSRGGRGALLSLLMGRARLALRGVRFNKRKEADVAPRLLRDIDASYAVASGLGTVDSLVGADVQTRGVLKALEAGEPWRVLRALVYEAGFRCGSLGGQEKSRAMLARAGELARELERPEAHGMVEFGVAFYHQHGVGDLLAARPAFERGEELLLGTPGMNGELAILRCSYVTLLDLLGDVHTLVQRLPGLMADAERRGDHLLFTSLVCAPLFWLARDAVPELDLYLENSRKLWPKDHFVMPHYWLMVAEMHRDLYAGDGRACVERLTPLQRELERSYYLSIPTVRIEVFHPRARGALMLAMDGHEPKAMLALAEADARALERTRRNAAQPLAKLLRASIAALRGQREQVPELLRDASSAASAQGLTMHAAIADLYRGKLVLGDEGKQLAHESTAILHKLGIRDVGRVARAIAPGLEPR
jgi:tetratricopeptide (TPR) repeat protein